MKPILFFGSVTSDLTLHVPHLPSLEEDLSLQEAGISLGGCPGNASKVLDYMHVPYVLACITGTGVYAEHVRKELKQRNQKPFFESSQANGFCLCLVTPEGNRTFIAIHGCEYKYSMKYLRQLNPQEYAIAYVSGIDLEEEENDCLLDWLEETHLPVCFAAGPRISSLQEDRLKRMTALKPLLHLNRREADAYLERFGLHAESMEERTAMLNDLAGNTVIITDGEKGACACGDTFIFQEAMKVNAVDGTGAGDTHIGTVLGCLSQEKPLATAMFDAALTAGAAAASEGAGLPLEAFERIREKLR